MAAINRRPAILFSLTLFLSFLGDHSLAIAQSNPKTYSRSYPTAAAKIAAVLYMHEKGASSKNGITIQYEGGKMARLVVLDIAVAEEPKRPGTRTFTEADRHRYFVQQSSNELNPAEQNTLEVLYDDYKLSYAEIFHRLALPIELRSLAGVTIEQMAMVYPQYRPAYLQFYQQVDGSFESSLTPEDWFQRYRFLDWLQTAFESNLRLESSIISNGDANPKSQKSHAVVYSAVDLKSAALAIDEIRQSAANFQTPCEDPFFATDFDGQAFDLMSVFEEGLTIITAKLKSSRYLVNSGGTTEVTDYQGLMNAEPWVFPEEACYESESPPGPAPQLVWKTVGGHRIRVCEDK